MQTRRQAMHKYVKDPQRDAIMSLVAFPRLGCPDFLTPSAKPNGPFSRSLYIPDEAINPHARFPTLTRNIRARRGSKVRILTPIFKDKKTPQPFLETFPPSLHSSAEASAVPASEMATDGKDGHAQAQVDHVYMDAMCFGMGLCCLQVTFQACSLDEARYLYDTLSVLCPIAVTPFFCFCSFCQTLENAKRKKTGLYYRWL